MEIRRITPICKGGGKEKFVEYMTISVLLCFSRILGGVVYSRLYLYLSENDLLYYKQFGSQKGHFTVMLSLELQIKYTTFLTKIFIH